MTNQELATLSPGAAVVAAVTTSLTEDQIRAMMSGEGDATELRKLTGQESGETNRDRLPFLKIQHHTEDQDENPVPKGHYTLSVDGVAMYAAKMTFRPFVRMFQYTYWDADKEEFHSTVLLPNNGDSKSFIDTKGGYRLGKLTGKEKDIRGPQDPSVLAQADVKGVNTIYGRVTLHDAVDCKGKPVECTDVECVWSSKGASYMPVSRVIDDFKGKNMWEYTILGETTSKKNKAIRYHIPNLQIGERVDVTPEDMDLMVKFAATVKGINEYVIGKWEEANREELVSEEDADLLSQFDA